MEDLLVAFVTVSGESRGREIARKIVEERLAACVNIVPVVRSIYHWEGSIEEEEESLLVIKTGKRLLERLKKRIPEIHPYDIPELIALPVAGGLEEYMEWALGELGTAEKG
jgi:periplasmic divalent cation tolerance protein